MYALVGPTGGLCNDCGISKLPGKQRGRGGGQSPMPRLARSSFPEWTGDQARGPRLVGRSAECYGPAEGSAGGVGQCARKLPYFYLKVPRKKALSAGARRFG